MPWPIAFSIWFNAFGIMMQPYPAFEREASAHED